MASVRILTIFFCFACCSAISGQDLRYALQDARYSEYSDSLRNIYAMLETADSASAYRIIRIVRNAAAEHSDPKTALEAAFMEIFYKLEQDFQTGDVQGLGERLRELEGIVARAEKARCEDIALRARMEIFDYYWEKVRNYELAFGYGLDLARRMERVDTRTFPDKLMFYLSIANLYYYFRNYDSAACFYNRIIEDNTASMGRWLPGSAYNGLGLIYRTHYRDLDRSDEMFRAILNLKPVNAREIRRYDIGEGVAMSNLGFNAFMRGDFDRAIPLLKSGRQKMLEKNDLYFAAGAAIPLAAIYMERGELKRSKAYIDSAEAALRRSVSQRRWKDLYPVMSRYYAAAGDARLAMIYMDSAFSAQERYNAEFNALQLYRAGQRAHLSEQRATEEELLLEKVRARAYRRNLTGIAVGLAVVMTLLVMYVVLYRKKQRAYYELVRKSRRWAESPTAAPAEKSDEVQVDPKRLQKREMYGELMKGVVRLMEEEKIYRNPELTLGSLAARLEVNRVYLSQAVNGTMGCNFSSFVNEYRIKDAIRIISDKRSDRFSIDQIACEAGFNDRKTFYRVFLKFTGLSPTELRNNRDCAKEAQ